MLLPVVWYVRPRLWLLHPGLGIISDQSTFQVNRQNRWMVVRREEKPKYKEAEQEIYTLYES